MSRFVRNGRWRVASALGAALAVIALPATPAWGASQVSTNCAGLQAAITGATTGETIDLTELCMGSSFTVPTATGVTIEGAAAGDGFDGTGAGGPALHGSAPSGLTLRNLIFENYNLTNTSSGGSSAVQLVLTSGALPVIDHDSFVNNTNTSTGVPVGGGLDIFGVSSTCPYTGSLTVSDSLFSGNVLATTSTDNSAGTGTAGGGASIALPCAASATANLVITGNTFRQNSIQTHGVGAYGAGLYVANSDSGQLTATQSGNVFESNSIVNTGSIATTFNGGGEWLASVNLVSSSDAYIGNSLPGPGAGSASEGAGLGAVRGSCGSSTVTTTATATDLVAAGNSIGTPSSGEVEGAGVYAGCEALQGSQGFQLKLIDSTVSGNSGPGGAAGVDGESGDTLALQNSIVVGNTGVGATDLGGFGATTGANVTAVNSDVCAIGTAAPFAGAGDICADPQLASASTGDVHETASSPTIDAGGDALVPVGASTDFYGQPRIVGTKQAQGIVDIGAAEFQTAFVPTTGNPNPPPPPPPPPNAPPPVAHVIKEKTTPSGVDVTIRCTGAASQRCSGRLGLATVEVRTGRKVIAVVSAKTKHRRVTTNVASATYALAGGRSMTVHLKLNRVGRHLLAQFHKLPVKATVTQVGKRKPISTRKLTIHPKKPKHHRH